MASDYEAMMEDAALEQMLNADMYEQDIDMAAEDYEARKRRTKIVTDNNNPWE